MFLAYVFQAFAIAAFIVVGTAFFLGLLVGRWRPRHADDPPGMREGSFHRHAKANTEKLANAERSVIANEN